MTGTIQSFGYSSKDKKKDKKPKKSKPFNLEAERGQIKSYIAEASIAATNLVNTLQSINRERERISDNQLAVQRFEACKQLRRKILRYVSRPWTGLCCGCVLTNGVRSINPAPKNTSAACCMPTTSWSRP